MRNSFVIVCLLHSLRSFEKLKSKMASRICFVRFIVVRNEYNSSPRTGDEGRQRRASSRKQLTRPMELITVDGHRGAGRESRLWFSAPILFARMASSSDRFGPSRTIY